jgi:hypothetical protein
MQSGEIVVDFLVGGERGLAIIRDRFVVARARLSVYRRARAEVEERDRCTGADGP